ncbi:MAG: c-type cytochrome [Deltaproteobacteria bacterium]|nr:c-type cytochrome [Deltaproteobacteria bacterium]
MKTFLKVVIFSLAVIIFYAFYAGSMIPQVKPAPPPAEAKLDMGSLTMEQFIQMGDEIFHGKGTCELCHNPVGGRAPLLDQAGKVAEERLKDSRYKGKAKTGEEYLRESMVEPSAFVVVGFGVTGTNDTQSPMPNVSTGAIGLKGFEVDAVIAYLQQKAGVTVTVQLPKEAPSAAAKEEAHPAAPAKTAEEVVNKYGCGACHKIAGQQGALGPDLTKIGAKKNKDYLRRGILNPNADIAPGFPAGMMPPDYGTKILAGEVEMLVDYMAKSK